MNIIENINRLTNLTIDSQKRMIDSIFYLTCFFLLLLYQFFLALANYLPGCNSSLAYCEVGIIYWIILALLLFSDIILIFRSIFKFSIANRFLKLLFLRAALVINILITIYTIIGFFL